MNKRMPVFKSVFIPGRKVQFDDRDIILDDNHAQLVVNKLLDDYPDINIKFVIDYLKSNIFTTVKCAEKLGISPDAFLRLRKKYKIYPVSVDKNIKISKTDFQTPATFKRTIKKYFTLQQLKVIPQEEIHLIQMRAARSLKYPNGTDKPWIWTRRGCHPNGKLRARTNWLNKHGVFVVYESGSNKYGILNKDNPDQNFNLTRQEVDKLNIQYGKLKAFA